MRRWSARPLRVLLGGAAVAMTAASASACGPPSYRFESSDSNDLVLRVPQSWALVRSGVPANSDGTQSEAGNWLAVFDSASQPSLDHARSTHATSPVAVVRSVVVTKAEGTAATDDLLRDVLYPVTTTGRQTAQLQGFTGTDFHLLSDRGISTKSAHGVHVVYSYNLGQGTEVYDQVAVTDAAKTRIHMLFVHCTKACYDANRQSISSTTQSFTVRTR